MPRLRIGDNTTDANLHGTVWDAADLLGSLVRTNLRSFLRGPWGKGDPALAAEMIRRCATPPCEGQCFVVEHPEHGQTTQGCSCSSGWQYTDDNDVQALEGCGPNDVWNDARGLLIHHTKVGRGPADPILCDCDDLTAICAACALYGAWTAAGSPMRDGRPIDPPGVDVRIAITKPPQSNMAHAWMASSFAPAAGEPLIKVNGLWVFDPAGRWGMRRPKDSFYGTGDVAVYPVRLSDL